MIIDLDRQALKKILRKKRIVRSVWKLNEIRKRVKELVSTDASDLSRTFKDGVLKSCDEVCVKKKSRKD